MKRNSAITIMLFAAAVCLSLTGCTKDRNAEAARKYVTGKSEIGLYKNKQDLYVFDKSANQCYLNTFSRVFRIQDNDAEKYLNISLSAVPEVGRTVDITVTSNISTLTANATYSGLTVVKMQDNLCWLSGGEDSGYAGAVIMWVTE